MIHGTSASVRGARRGDGREHGNFTSSVDDEQQKRLKKLLSRTQGRLLINKVGEQ